MSNIRTDGVPENQSGKLIALEGDTDIISTQLRLLPPSQKILILPNIEVEVAPEHENDAFNARAFIRDLQAAVTQRTETARSFLRLSTPTQPRLVFTIHGNVNARSTCITKISQNLTNGNVEEAESLFNTLVKDGIAGLSEAEGKAEEDQAETQEITIGHGKKEEAAEFVEESRDAAQSQDRATAMSKHGTVLQQPPPRDTSAKSHVKSLLQNLEQQKARTPSKIPKSKLASRICQIEDQIITTVLTVPDRKSSLADKGATFGSSQVPKRLSRRTGEHSSQAENGLNTDDDFSEPKMTSPSEYSIMSVPQTPSGVVYGEACLVDMHSGSPTKSIRKAKSFDKLPSSDAHLQTLSPNAHRLKQSKSDCHLRHNPSSLAVSGNVGHDTSGFPTLPRTAFLKASETTIKKSPPTSIRSSSKSSIQKVALTDRANYVERGTDSHDPFPEESIHAPFLPAFELVEDLVIQFTDNRPNEIFESVVRSYKNGKYPILPLTPATPTSSKMSSSPTTSSNNVKGHQSSSSPRSISSMQLEQLENDPDARPSSLLTAETDDDKYDRRSFDPYSDESYSPDIKRQWPPGGHSRTVVTPASHIGLPTPPIDAETPLPQETEESPTDDRFIDFFPGKMEDAISVQNSFRELLSILFPRSENYCQNSYRLAPEADRLWKPVFRNDETRTVGTEGRNVDQIIAFGCEDGVKTDFFHQISGQIEKIGAKKDGLNRSGKLDIRYLVSNVMQSYVNSSITSGAPSPISDPQVLASLLVPQIEAFLASNFTIRLLVLHFSSASFPTILALQSLLGTDLFKIAGILDTLASDPPPITLPGTSASSSSRLNGSNNPAIKSTNSFAKADYLLPSTATDTEISTFLSGLWKVLMEKSPFYTPEPEPKPVIDEKPPIPPMSRERDSGSLRVPRVSFLAGGNPTVASSSARGSLRASSMTSVLTKSAAIGAGAVNTLSASAAMGSTPPRHKYAESVTSTKTSTSQRERNQQTEKEWENFYIADDDSDDDAYDKMILGRGMQKITPEVKKPGQKANTKKALKWLGLA